MISSVSSVCLVGSRYFVPLFYFCQCYRFCCMSCFVGFVGLVFVLVSVSPVSSRLRQLPFVGFFDFHSTLSFRRFRRFFYLLVYSVCFRLCRLVGFDSSVLSVSSVLLSTVSSIRSPLGGFASSVSFHRFRSSVRFVDLLLSLSFVLVRFVGAVN